MTLEMIGERMQLFPKQIQMEPVQVKVQSNNTVGLVFATGTVLVGRQALTGHMTTLGHLFESNEEKKLKDKKDPGFDIREQQIEFLESGDTNCIRTLVLSRPD